MNLNFPPTYHSSTINTVTNMPITALPNEIITSIFSILPIKDLLTATLISKQLHVLAVCTLHHHLICLPTSTPSLELILEAYHPSAKITTPYLSCRHLGFKGLPEEVQPPLESLASIYSCFRPVVTEENRQRRFRMLWPGAAAPPAFNPDDIIDEEATEEVHLDDGELFSQLCVVTNVVKEGGKKGMFVKHVNISEDVMRIFRRWLNKHGAVDGDVQRKNWDDVGLDDDGVLWADLGKNIGLRFRVALASAERMPLISGPDDEPAVSYTMVYEGMCGW